MEKLTALCKNRGFVFPGSEAYGGLANAWDYGPLGVELKNNIKRAWRRKFVQERECNVELDSAILMNPAVWKASGHLAGFSDPLMDCKSCKTRHRADELIERHMRKTGEKTVVAGWSNERMERYISDNGIKCPNCGGSEFTGVRQFNLMFKTFQGSTEDSASAIYLRPETAQGIFVNFCNVVRSMRARVPFGIAQIGKSFRNEITPGNYIFRTREFEQMELEFFCKPGTDSDWFEHWLDFCENWLKSLGLNPAKLRKHAHSDAERCFYSKATVDFEYEFPFGWGELWGVANRADYDLTAHMSASGKDMTYSDPVTNERYVPFVIEPSLGADRAALAFLCDAYREESVGSADSRVVMRFHPALAPFKAAVLPLQRRELGAKALEVRRSLMTHFNCAYDETGSIGRRYRRQDEIGTPFCATIDFDTLADDTVTVRDRDSMAQVRVSIAKLPEYVSSRIEF